MVSSMTLDVATSDAGQQGRTLTVLGLGYRAAADFAALTAAVASWGGAPADALATAERKRGDAGIRMLAERLGLPLHFVADAALDAASARATMLSARVAGHVGVASVAEAAALHVAGPAARLLCPRRVVGPVTLAVAEGVAP